MIFSRYYAVENIDRKTDFIVQMMDQIEKRKRTAMGVSRRKSYIWNLKEQTQRLECARPCS